MIGEDGKPLPEQPTPATIDTTRAAVRHELGYGLHVANPEAFIRAVIKHFFSPLPRQTVDWDNVVHEARVALFEQDLRLDGAIPENTSGYWWRAGAAVGAMLYEDYNIDNMFVRRRRPFSLYATSPDDPATAMAYALKQECEEDPTDTTEAREWFEHYMSLAEGVLLDHKDSTQGERDLAVFELWVNGHSPLEIANRDEINWLKNRESVDAALRRIISRLWEAFGVDPETHVMTVGEYSSTPERTRTGTSSDPKKTFQNWYANPENRERHRQKARERMRRLRAEAKQPTN